MDWDSPAVSKLSARLLKRYTMLEECCPSCRIPLMQSTTGEVDCVECGKIYELSENSWVEVASDSVPSVASANLESSPAPQKSNSRRRPDCDSDEELMKEMLAAEEEKSSEIEDEDEDEHLDLAALKAKYSDPEKDKKREAVSKNIGQKLLQGWTMLAESCPLCPEAPLMRNRQNEDVCPSCDKTYKSSISQEASKSIEAKEEKHHSEPLASSQDGKKLATDDNQVLRMTTPITLNVASKKADKASLEQSMSKLLLEGWALTGETCHFCTGVVLMRDKQRKRHCLSCKRVYVDPTVASQLGIVQGKPEGLSSQAPIPAIPGASVPSSLSQNTSVTTETQSTGVSSVKRSLQSPSPAEVRPLEKRIRNEFIDQGSTSASVNAPPSTSSPPSVTTMQVVEDARAQVLLQLSAATTMLRESEQTSSKAVKAMKVMQQCAKTLRTLDSLNSRHRKSKYDDHV